MNGLSEIINEVSASWFEPHKIEGKTYTCGYCGSYAAPSKGYIKVTDARCSRVESKTILICPNCDKPTYLENGKQYPNIIGGISVKGINDEKIALIYEEARKCMITESYTACVLCCRKALMNIAVSNEAEEGKKFAYYVNYLSDKGYIPPNGKVWVDEIRKIGNEATHEINIISKDQAELALNF